MIVNTDTGEILDLSGLRREPLGRVRRMPYRHQGSDNALFIALIALIVSAISLAIQSQ